MGSPLPLLFPFVIPSARPRVAIRSSVSPYSPAGPLPWAPLPLSARSKTRLSPPQRPFPFPPSPSPRRVTTDPGPLTHAAALVVKMAAPCVYCSKQQGRIRGYDFCTRSPLVGFYLRFRLEYSILRFLFRPFALLMDDGQLIDDISFSR